MVDWRGDTPFSPQFNDVYYQHDGLNESRHVFLCGNDLPQRWQGKDNFVVGELGFGTGLNFLALWDLWQKQEHRPVLHVYSTELFPLSKDAIAKAHQFFPDIHTLSTSMLAHYPDHFEKDWHFENDEVALTVLWGDAFKRLPEIPEPADAWLLDGFAPANNPELWSEDIFKMITSKSKPGTSFATFTVARAVRDHAQNAGFTLQKRKGFGRKRDMLTGVYNG